MLMVHHHCDAGTVIMRADRFIPGEDQKNRVLVNTVLVRISRAVDGKHLSAGIRHTVFRIALTVPLLPESGTAEAVKLANIVLASTNRLSERIFIYVSFLVVFIPGYQGLTVSAAVPSVCRHGNIRSIFLSYTGP